MQTALVVDDSKSARFALRKYLENCGFKVDTADGAEEAYGYVRSSRPQIIFLDHIMPGIDGLQALEHLKADPATAGIPVVICSSNDEPAFQTEARAKGAHDTLQKPPQPEQLTRILEGLQGLGKAAAEPPRPAVVVPMNSKVSNIREPEVAIEQAVMKQLRSAVQPPPAAPRIDAPVVPVMNAADPTPATALREQMDARMKKLAQDLFMQMAEIKGTLTHLESRADAAAATDDALQQLRTRMAQLESNVETRLQEHSQRIGEIADHVRATVAAEAHAVAERTMMAAATRISTQLADTIMTQVADSILKALGRTAGESRVPRRAGEN